MRNDLWTFFAIIAGFMGFLLGYSTPPMIEVGLQGGHAEAMTTEENATTEQDIEDYYKSLQDLQ